MRVLDGLMGSLRNPGRRRQGRMGRDEAIACALLAGRCPSCQPQRGASSPPTEPPAPPADSSSAPEGCSCDGSFDFIR
jgi:hypothetical protein